MSLIRIDLNVADAQVTVDSHLRQRSGDRPYTLMQIAKYLERLAAGGSSVNSGTLITGAVKASGTVTLSSIVADDTVTINGRIYTGKDVPSGAQQFLTGSTDTASATSLAAKINADTSPLIAGVVTATSALGVVTVTCTVPGLVGNSVTIAISAHGSVSGSGKLASGAEASNTSIPA
jgi:phage tail sheath gpL-like